MQAKCKPDDSKNGLGDRPGYLYRYWAVSGVLLYIGISVNAVARLAQHRGQEWFPRIGTITVERFDTYAEAELAELRAICFEGPFHNMKGPRDEKDLGPALAKLRAAQRRRGVKPVRPPKEHKLYGAYTCDLAFDCIPAGTTFEEYLARPEWHPEKERRSA